MNKNQRKFFATKYAAIPRLRILTYAILVMAAFGILGIMTSQTIFFIIGLGVAIAIPIFGRFLDYSRTDPPALKIAGYIYTVVAVVYAILVLALIVVPGIVSMVKHL